MRRAPILLALFALGSGSPSPCVAAGDAGSEPEQMDCGVDGSPIRLALVTAALGAGATWGDGVLVIEDERHPFSIRSAGLANVGFSIASLTGRLCSETHASIDGTYVGVEGALVVAGGGSAGVWVNEHGTVLRLSGTRIGLQAAAAAQGLILELH